MPTDPAPLRPECQELSVEELLRRASPPPPCDETVTEDLTDEGRGLLRSGSGTVELRPGVAISDDVLADFAFRHGVRRLSAFGSVLRSDFNPHSDVDLLVEFETDRTPGLFGIAAMELELSGILEREVDLRTYGDLSRYFRDQVRDTAIALYAA